MKAMANLALLVALTMAASGCICGGGDTTQTQGTTDTGANTGQPEVTTTVKETATTVKVTATTAAQGGGILSDLKAALSSGAGYKCTYDFNGMTSESWVKGKKFASKTNVDNQVGHTISDGTWMYSWEDGQRQGVKFNIEEMKRLGEKSQGGQQKQPSMDEVANAASNVRCAPEVMSDSTFTPPSDVEFQDMGAMVKQLQEAMGTGGKPDLSKLKGLAGNIPDEGG
jgi:hypothetical protein